MLDPVHAAIRGMRKRRRALVPPAAIEDDEHSDDPQQIELAIRILVVAICAVLLTAML